MNESKMFEEIRELCVMNGIAIDKIAKEHNVNQNQVGKLFIITMSDILSRTEEMINDRGEV